MKALLLVGAHPLQRALACRLAALTTRSIDVVAIDVVAIDVVAIVQSQNIPRQAKPQASQILLNRVAGRTIGLPLTRAWLQLVAHYAQQFPSWPAVETIAVRNVNDDATLAAIERHRPELIVVSGTNLVGKRLITATAAAGGRIVNLHTGISPYVKGGPNCTNWCLAQRWFDRIGNTIMWLDAGIDTGALIATERTPLTGRESLFELHLAVMEHAHDLYGRAVAAIASAPSLVARVPQAELGEGTTFYTAEWNALAMARAYFNFRMHYARGVKRPPATELRLVALP